MRTINREIVGGFIFSNDGYILMGVSQPGGVYPGHLMIPGGGVNEGESKTDAIKREVLEEVSIDVSDAQVSLVNDEQYGESEKTLRDTGELVLVKMHFNDFVIYIDKPASAIYFKSEDDFADARWVKISDLPKQKLTEPTIITLKKVGYL